MKRLVILLAYVLLLAPVSACLSGVNVTNSTELLSALECLEVKINNTNVKLTEINVSNTNSHASLDEKYNAVMQGLVYNSSFLLNRTLLLREDCLKMNESLSNSLGNMTKEVNDCYNKSEAEKLEARVDWNTNQSVNRVLLDDFKGNLSDEFGAEKSRLEDIFDEKISSLKVRYLTLEQFENQTSYIYADFYRIADSRMNVYDRYMPYVFLLVAGIVIAIILVWKYGPLKQDKGLFLKKPKTEVRTSVEMLTESDLKRKVDRIRDLKLKAIGLKLDKNKRALLLKKIDNGEMDSEKDLENEVKILKGT